jgi:hypothetical protein
MSRSTASQAYGFVTPRDVFDKLNREIARFELLDGCDVDELKDAGFNIAVTAWTLKDWLWEELQATGKLPFTFADGMTCSSRSAFDSHILKNKDIHRCRIYATSAKHAVVRNRPDPTIYTVASAAFIQVRRPHKLKIVDDDGRHEAKEVFARASAFWGEVLTTAGM